MVQKLSVQMSPSSNRINPSVLYGKEVVKGVTVSVDIIVMNRS
jgi:uncharacterized protein (DUF433 family)